MATKTWSVKKKQKPQIPTWHREWRFGGGGESLFLRKEKNKDDLETKRRVLWVFFFYMEEISTE